MLSTTPSRLTGVLLASILAAGLVGAAAAPTAAAPASAAAAAPASDGAYYLYDTGNETRFPAGHVSAWDDELVGSPSSRDARAHFTCASDAESVQTFISPVGKERTRASWLAYADSGFFFGTKDVVEPSATLGSQILGSAGQVRAAGGDYSVGVACLKFNNVQLASAGIWFTTAHVTAGSGAWAADQAPAPRPLTTVRPTISGGSVVGTTLAAKAGAWGPAPVTLGYQWNRGDIPIPGATAATYRVPSSDLGYALSVTVKGSKPGYETAAATSALTVPVRTALTATPTPTVAGTATVGRTLTARPGTWAPATVTLAYQWNRNGAKIAGATKSTFLLAAADAATTLTVTVTGSKSGYATTSRTSTATTAIAKGALTTATPTIGGTASVGATLTAKPGTWGPAPVALASVWKRAGAIIPGASGGTYKLVSADAGKAITVSVTGTRSGYLTVTKTSAPVTPAK